MIATKPECERMRTGKKWEQLGSSQYWVWGAVQRSQLR